MNNEKIDIIQYSDEPRQYLSAALAPAESLAIEVNAKDQTAIVTAPDDQLSLAIGRGGQNVRLAAKLTDYQITIKSATGEEQATATGEEEYEIDQIADLTAETRQYMIENRVTTLEDLQHKWETFSASDRLEEGQRELLDAARQSFVAQMAEEETVIIEEVTE